MLEGRFIRDIESIERRGKPSLIRHLEFEKYKSDIPEALAYIWARFGISSWAGGVFQTCDPDLYKDGLEYILQGNKVISSSGAIPFALSSFGIMKAWHLDVGVFEIQFPLARIILPMRPEELLAKKLGDINFISRFPTSEADFSTIKGFKEAQKKLGKLNENEMYGFEPALGLGGSADLSTVRRLAADVHLGVLAGIQPFKTYFFESSGPVGYVEI